MYYFPSHTVKSDRAFPMPFTHLPAASGPRAFNIFSFIWLSKKQKEDRKD